MPLCLLIFIVTRLDSARGHIVNKPFSWEFLAFKNVTERLPSPKLNTRIERVLMNHLRGYGRRPENHLTGAKHFVAVHEEKNALLARWDF